ncbi:YciI family protein [Nonomuraea sp. NPDC050556]|uniref:YciI family protein n=1 Tax=Nonomuraea sp. NPDC050556 TaxID=3364369 RepID=UPI00379AE225
MRYILFLTSDQNATLGPPPQDLIEAIGRHGEEMTAAGVLLATGGLSAPGAGARLRLSDGSTTPIDAKEQIEAYALINVDSHEHAVSVAEQFLGLHAKYWPAWQGEAEVRQVFGPEA